MIAMTDIARTDLPHQQGRSAQRRDLDGREACGVGGGGHGLDAAQEDLRVLLTGGLALQRSDEVEPPL